MSIARALVIVAAALFPTVAVAQNAQFRLTMAWTQDPTEAGERSRLVMSRLLVTLMPGAKVLESYTRLRGGRPGRRTRVQEGELGEDFSGVIVGRWRVLNAHSLIRLAAHTTHTFTIRLTTDGLRSCSIALEWRAKDGVSTLVEQRQTRRGPRVDSFTQPTVHQANCEVMG
ncbi:hypothetical protein [Bosea sp. PAMC 26642]|uniref:hypothetical protein n=1 Tax=Bosea sp. (strain PAMC 26642) TaxID=1792307 RepID=UPI0012E71B20|nr:hypothetical protein [Bosea sp. PAMC 26642]